MYNYNYIRICSDVIVFADFPEYIKFHFVLSGDSRKTFSSIYFESFILNCSIYDILMYVGTRYLYWTTNHILYYIRQLMDV
jgi:hypothetical protein